MGINSPRIAGKPVTERRRIPYHTMPVYPGPPNEAYVTLDDQGAAITVNPIAPDREGQLYVYTSIDSTFNNRTARIYVGVLVNGMLEWKEAVAGTLVDSYTGQARSRIGA